MLFLGTTFFSGRNTVDPPPSCVKDVQKITMSTGIYDQIYVSKSSDTTLKEVNDGEWNSNTIFNADYESGTPHAGNSAFSVANTDHVVIKCREKGTMDWIPIYVKEINSTKDFDIEVQDYFRPSQKIIEYMVCSYCNNIETAFVIKEMKSEFDCMCICEKDTIYGSLYNLDYMDTNIETKSSTLDLLNSKYPTVTNNSSSHYETGTATGAFVKFNENTGLLDVPAGIQFRDDVKNFLNDKKPKILKFHDGRIWLVSVGEQINDAGSDHNDVRTLSFDWIEIGNVNDVEFLYNNGLSDIDPIWAKR